ncbi:MAG: rod shape-determining protein RodA [Desulfomonilaceae bacterium]|nr:rod shape-determining protein RodA [Desulfomonilaceae bacterium]
MIGSHHGSTLATATRFEWPLIVISLLLAAIGVCIIYSATVPMGDVGMSLVLRQITWCSLGLILMAAFLLTDYRFLERWAVWFYLAVVVALVVVWSLGKVTAGSKRWIDLGLMQFQPSEFAKLAVVIILAKVYQDFAGKTKLHLRDLTKPFILAAIPVFLVFVQPDLGTGGVIALIAVSMTVFVGIERRALLVLGTVAACAVPVAWLAADRLLFTYQKRRLLTYLNPDYDPLGSGYHIMQSHIAIGSGGLLGKGYLQGTQNQLMFLPAKHTDFVFSILAEEWGFVGCATVLVLFSLLFLRGMAVAAMSRDSFGALAAFGCTTIIFWHVAINIGMVMGLLPVVGVPLSFLSYGGSSLLSSFLVIAILVNVSMRRFTF